MLFMLIERFRDNDMLPIYKRLRDVGRMLPDGLTYVDSWIEPNFSRCFQLMECQDLRLLQKWALEWRGSGATFEIVPAGRQTTLVLTEQGAFFEDPEMQRYAPHGQAASRREGTRGLIDRFAALF